MKRLSLTDEGMAWSGIHFAVEHLMVGKAAAKFLESMRVTFDMMHDGLGYDLDALDEAAAEDRDQIEQILIERQPRDWRDIEALARFDSQKSRDAVEAGLTSPDPKVRREATRHAPSKLDLTVRARLLVQALNTTHLYGGLGEAIDEAAAFHPPEVIDALLHGALYRDSEAAVHFAALLFYIHGKSAEPFDWNHRPFFLRFATEARSEREAAFRELCQIIGIDPGVREFSGEQL